MARKMLIACAVVLGLAGLQVGAFWIICCQQFEQLAKAAATIRDRIATQDRRWREAHLFRTLQCADRIEMVCFGTILDSDNYQRIGPIIITNPDMVKSISGHFLRLKDIRFNEYPFYYSVSGPHVKLTFLCKDRLLETSVKVDWDVLLFDNEACYAELTDREAFIEYVFDIARKHAEEHPDDVCTVIR